MKIKFLNILKLVGFGLAHAIIMGFLYDIVSSAIIILSIKVNDMSVLLPTIAFSVFILALTVLYVKIRIKYVGAALTLNIVLIPAVYLLLGLLGFSAYTLELFGVFEQFSIGETMLVGFALILFQIEYILTVIVYYICKIVSKRKKATNIESTSMMSQAINDGNL